MRGAADGSGAPGYRRAIVVGGGLAGITAALDLADAGAQVTLLEVRRQLGGAVYSFERDGRLLDNGQHVFLRCCTAYRELLARLGSEDGTFLQPKLRIPVLSPGRAPCAIWRNGLPAPLHLGQSLLRYPRLTVGERVSAVRAALALSRVDPDDPANDQRTLGEWLAAHGQGPRALAALWDLIALPTLNLPANEASLALGAFVFRVGLLSDRAAGDIGVHVRPLIEIIGRPALAALQAAGVDVRRGCPAKAVEPGPVVQIEGETLEADVVILALPHQRVGAVMAQAAVELDSSPIVNLHLRYDRPVFDGLFAAGVQTPVQYLFARGPSIALSLSGAREEMQLSSEELRARYEPALAELLPAARGARVEHFQVSREHAATFFAGPGVQARRPGPQTGVPGVWRAGAYTQTGWPATMEGAVMSGHRAAELALGRG
ncbi:MAG TPA: hydroxysqualene dehydroxylase HpnE [Solirubrobacteraceae bacterium]|jgi:squalene-associated FAD-dependent desaturase|nr:hydroxysqualene dehydroxylase HpnE [Solirubrobacteraceae bacterium]